jgi:hypothetical protein
MADKCWFCHSPSNLHQVDGMTMCGDCGSDWFQSPEQRQEMLRGQNTERMERNLQDPGYIYDLRSRQGPGGLSI